jgi:cell division protein FtsL
MIIHILIYTYMCMLKYIDAIIIIITITVIIIIIFIIFRRARDFEIQRLKEDRIQEENVQKQRLLDEKNEIQRYIL